MGASLLCRTYPDMPEAQLKKEVDDQRSQDAHEDGTSYSGSWGVKHGLYFDRVGNSSYGAVKVFDTVMEAEDYIADHNDKWGPLTAVKAKNLGDNKPITFSKKFTELEEKVAEATKTLQAFGPAIITRVKAAKSKTRGCAKCESSIATSYIRSLQCPVCQHEFLMTPTDRTKRDALKAKLEKLTQAAEELRKEEIKKQAAAMKETVWVVGGLCSS